MEIDPQQMDRRAAYQLMISIIVPRPIAFVTTVSPQGQPNLAPFSFFNGVSSQPPILMIAVGSRKGQRKDTWANIEATGEFVVNAVVPELVDAMVVSSVDYPAGVNEIVESGLTPVPSRLVRPPRLGESPINLECRVEKLVEVSGTALILGRIVLYHVRDDLLVAGKVDPQRLRPVARLGGDSYAFLGEVFRRSRPK